MLEPVAVCSLPLLNLYLPEFLNSIIPDADVEFGEIAPLTSNEPELVVTVTSAFNLSAAFTSTLNDPFDEVTLAPKTKVVALNVNVAFLAPVYAILLFTVIVLSAV